MNLYTYLVFALNCIIYSSYGATETGKGFTISYGKHLTGEVTFALENTTDPVISYLKSGDDDDDIYKVSNSEGKVCSMATLDASILIRYETTNKGIQQVTLEVPDELETEGNCNGQSGSDQLVLKWSSFKLCFFFNKGEESWALERVHLSFNTSEAIFEGATQDETPSLSADVKSIRAPLGKAYRCKAAKEMELSDGDKYSATLTLSDLKIQPYLVNGPNFGEEAVCSDDLGPRRRKVDETVPIAVGSTLAIVSLSTVVAYAVYRYFKIKSVTYNTME